MVILSVAFSTTAGAMLGYLVAAAKMLGQAELHPPNALPVAPRLEEWMAVGAVAGAGVGLVKGGVALILRKMNRRRSHHGVL